MESSEQAPQSPQSKLSPTVSTTSATLIMNNLFKLGTSRADSSLVYEATFFPLAQLRAPHRIVWSKEFIMTKQAILNFCDADLTELTLPGHGNMTFPISWQFNCVPTELEWNKITPDSVFIVECKISPLIQGGRTANLIPLHRKFVVARAA